MQTLQQDIFGETVNTTPITKEVELIANKYPDYLDNDGAFLFVCAKNRYPWIRLLDEKQIRDLREIFHDAPSIDRARRDYKVKDKERAKYGF